MIFSCDMTHSQCTVIGSNRPEHSPNFWAARDHAVLGLCSLTGSLYIQVCQGQCWDSAQPTLAAWRQEKGWYACGCMRDLHSPDRPWETEPERPRRDCDRPAETLNLRVAARETCTVQTVTRRPAETWRPTLGACATSANRVSEVPGRKWNVLLSHDL